jgi:hypothetical protein
MHQLGSIRERCDFGGLATAVIFINKLRPEDRRGRGQLGDRNAVGSVA